MGRPKKLYEGEQKVMSEEYPSVKHLVQAIALNANSDARSAKEVDEVVGVWIDRGYTMITAFPYANAPDYIQVLYVLVKQPVV